MRKLVEQIDNSWQQSNTIKRRKMSKKILDKFFSKNYPEVQLYAGGEYEEDDNTFSLNKELEARGYYPLSRNGFGKPVVIDGYTLESYIAFELKLFKEELSFDSEAGCTFVYPQTKKAEIGLKKIKAKILYNPTVVVEDLVTNELLNQSLLRYEDIKKILSTPIQPQHNGEDIKMSEINDYAVTMYNSSKFRKSLNAFSYGLNTIQVNEEDKAMITNNIGFLLAELATKNQSKDLNQLAAEYYQKAINLGYQSYNNLAIIYYDIKQYDQALATVEIGCQHNDINSFNTKCNILIQMGRKDQAKQALADGLKVAEKIDSQEEINFFNTRILNFDLDVT